MSLQEAWKPWPRDAEILVSDQGRVKSFRSGQERLLTPSTRNQYGHQSVRSRSRKRDTQMCEYVHKLVLETFVGPRKSGQVARHLDGNHLNNALSNLAWGTQLQNAADARQHGTLAQGERNHFHKLTEAQVLEIRASSLRDQELADHYGVSRHLIGKIRLRRIWRHI